VTWFVELLLWIFAPVLDKTVDKSSAPRFGSAKGAGVAAEFVPRVEGAAPDDCSAPEGEEHGVGGSSLLPDLCAPAADSGERVVYRLAFGSN
jgi:hypothetical protein